MIDEKYQKGLPELNAAATSIQSGMSRRFARIIYFAKQRDRLVSHKGATLIQGRTRCFLCR